ncbi:lytic transglycosylase domain-containing protein [Methylobacterium aerolatum]|uniref:Lytic transglycosylase n=1 Tax=Methylobacterium aerolatum TaxID=418708 RepID=A0ABU0I5H0_9HYPH|nr:lytic transglycosylase domain-containing protein [Methylobacterium aerolatum]MDQ0448874.1 hypothetical protein [Methylobacterium aerolatum]GJD34238.1 hypothetical protein FMGBMHLM_1136 [Methylobacterium aerolatum]
MFLFTTTAAPPEPPEPPAIVRQAPAPVVQAIRDGASATGVGFDYLLATARRESSLDPSAKAPTSSATGLFQFIEQTWLGTLKSAGPQLGLQAEANAIARQPDGSYTVPDTAQRQAILDLRRDPKVASVLAGALTQKNAQALEAALGREPTAGDLYAAHVLGAKGAASLIANARTFPERSAALDLPEAAAANHGLFYDRSGRPKTSAELYASLSAAAQSQTAAAPPAITSPLLRQDGGGLSGSATATPAAPVTAAAFGGGGDLRSLFQTERRPAATDATARLLQSRVTASAPARPALSYFPRSDDSASTERPVQVASADPDDGPATTGSLALPATPAGPALVHAPLPPRRPVEFATARLSTTLFDAPRFAAARPDALRRAP